VRYALSQSRHRSHKHDAAGSQSPAATSARPRRSDSGVGITTPWVARLVQGTPEYWDPPMPHATQLSAADTGLLVVDVQEKLVPKIRDHAAMVRNIRFLLDGAKLLQIPMQITEQYPKGLGATVPELIGSFPQRPDKTAFS